MELQVIGETAGKVWNHLANKGQASMQSLAKSVGTDVATAQLAVGWLAREGKVKIGKSGARILVSLTDEESRVSERQRR